MLKTIARHARDFAEFAIIGAGTCGTAMLIAAIVAAYTGGAVAL